MSNKPTDPRIEAMVVKKAGEKLDLVLTHAEELMVTQGKSHERALADALENFKLV